MKDVIVEEPIFAGTQRGKAGQFPLLARIAFIAGSSISTILAGIVANNAGLGHSIIVVPFIAETIGSGSSISAANCAIGCSSHAGFALMLTGSTVICICNIVEFIQAGAAAIGPRGAGMRSMGVGDVAG